MDKVFIVVDVQVDFCAGGALGVAQSKSLIEPLNAAIRKAESQDMLIICTRDWHPENHSSFERFGGEWLPHCIGNTSGAQFHPQLIIPERCEIVNKGMDIDKDGYSPYENPKMKELIYQPNIKNVYVTGIALEYCVSSTCLDTIKLGKHVVAVEPLIRSISEDRAAIEERWAELVEAGVVRAQCIGHE